MAEDFVAKITCGERKYSETLKSNKEIFRDFKEQLCISLLVKIMKEARSWDEVRAKTKDLQPYEGTGLPSRCSGAL